MDVISGNLHWGGLPILPTEFIRINVMLMLKLEHSKFFAKGVMLFNLIVMVLFIDCYYGVHSAAVAMAVGIFVIDPFII